MAFENSTNEFEFPERESAPDEVEEMYEPAHAPAVEEDEEEGNDYYITFKKPFVFEDETYTGVDLSGLEDLSARDMIATQRSMERSGSINVIPEMSLEYACLFAARASGLPQEFFQSLPPREAIKVKNRVTSFFYGEE